MNPELTNKIWEAFLVILGGIITGVIGFITGWLLNKSQRSDERWAGIEDRRRDFLAFMEQLRAEAEREIRQHGAFFVFYQNKIPNIRHAAKFISQDFPKEERIEFKKLVATAISYDPGKHENENQKLALVSIDAVITFVERQ